MAHAWFAVRTRSRAEKSVRDQLERKGLEPFLPTYSRWSQWKDRVKAVDWPLVTGYCFARFEPEERLAVVTCPGVVGVLTFGGVLAAVSDAEIESLQRLVASELKYDPAPMLREGAMVEVVRGPLKGAIGRLVRKGKHTRLLLSVEIIGRAVSAEVDASAVKPY